MINTNYPRITLNNRNYLLSIHPEWHTRLFPDSKLNNEPASMVNDISHSNSIDKVFLTSLHGSENLLVGDNILIYRTSDHQGPARYRSVATSVCVVTEVLNIKLFLNFTEFRNYCSPYSVFTDHELETFFRHKKYQTIIKFTYNIPLCNRVTRENLMKITGYGDNDYWGILHLNDIMLKKIIIDFGGINENFIIDQT